MLPPAKEIVDWRFLRFSSFFFALFCIFIRDSAAAHSSSCAAAAAAAAAVAAAAAATAGLVGLGLDADVMEGFVGGGERDPSSFAII
jgi:hypothetical protein